MKFAKHYWLLFMLVTILWGCKSNSQDTTSGDDTREKLYFDEYYVTFSVRDIDGLVSPIFDSLPWRASIKNLPQNGQVAYFFFDEAEGEYGLGIPHIRAEYIYKRMTWCSTQDSLKQWLKSIYLSQTRNGQIVLENEMVKTYSGEEAELFGIYTPSTMEDDTIARPERFMTWVYLDQGDYFLGFVLTAFDKVRNDRGIALFKELLSTYEKEERHTN